MDENEPAYRIRPMEAAGAETIYQKRLHPAQHQR